MIPIPAMSDANASQTSPWPGSCLAMSNVYSEKSRSSTVKSTLGERPISPREMAIGKRLSTIGAPSAPSPVTR